MAFGKNRTVYDGHFGDNGKGKIVPYLAEKYDDAFVVRYSGGDNAGHSFHRKGRRVVSHLVPTGLLVGKRSFLARGVRVNPFQVLHELADIREQGFALPPLYIDAAAQLSFDWHRAIEWWVEHQKDRGGTAAYTTMKGMCGVAAAEVLRVNPQVGLLLEPSRLRDWLHTMWEVFHPILTHPDVVAKIEVPSVDSMMAKLLEAAEAIRPMVCDTRQLLYDAWQKGGSLLFEAAQGCGLDPYIGTYPYNTSGLCTPAGVPVATGLPDEAIGTKVMVVKAYATRVGNGPFDDLGDPRLLATEPRPMEVNREVNLAALRANINAGTASDLETGRYLRQVGHEYGATSGRARRTGWFNAAFVRHMVEATHPHELAVTKLDCLSGLGRIPVITGYRRGSQALGIPTLAHEFDGLEPVYRDLPGWEKDITGVTQLRDLPQNARAYLEYLQTLVGCPITMIGTGPDHDHLILCPDGCS